MTIQIFGLLICGNEIYVGMPVKNDVVEPGYDPFKLGLVRIFEYPSRDHLGELAK
jgi:hypothetical protein